MHDETEDTSEPPPARKPYQAPRVLESARFETLALGCNKFPVDTTCLVNPPTSGS